MKGAKNMKENVGNLFVQRRFWIGVGVLVFAPVLLSCVWLRFGTQYGHLSKSIGRRCIIKGDPFQEQEKYLSTIEMTFNDCVGFVGCRIEFSGKPDNAQRIIYSRTFTPWELGAKIVLME